MRRFIVSTVRLRHYVMFSCVLDAYNASNYFNSKHFQNQLENAIDESYQIYLIRPTRFWDEHGSAHYIFRELARDRTFDVANVHLGLHDMRAGEFKNLVKNGFYPYFMIWGQFWGAHLPLISLQYLPFSCRQTRCNFSKGRTTNSLYWYTRAGTAPTIDAFRPGVVELGSPRALLRPFLSHHKALLHQLD